jgi:hypothetical protein
MFKKIFWEELTRMKFRTGPTPYNYLDEKVIAFDVQGYRYRGLKGKVQPDD